MELINIVPIANLEYTRHQPMAMFLTHLVEKYPEYADFARSYKGYKILDNSLIELGGAVSLECVLAAARTIKADEIVLPDVFQKGSDTLISVCDACTQLATLDPDHTFKYMAVCQGRDAAEFEKTFRVLESMKRVDVIGIPKVCAKMHPEGRPHFEYLWADRKCPKPIHLLGIWYSFEECSRYRNPDGIRSMDTCLPAFFAKYELYSDSVRPDGFTLDLEADNISYRRYKGCQPYLG